MIRNGLKLLEAKFLLFYHPSYSHIINHYLRTQHLFRNILETLEYFIRSFVVSVLLSTIAVYIQY